MDRRGIRIKRIKLKAKRRYDCKYYPVCLWFAGFCLLPGVPCKECNNYEPGRPTTEKDVDGIIELFRAVFNPKTLKIKGDT